jgi:prepilin-type N-terminal cleavage/methylation domain-containing protein
MRGHAPGFTLLEILIVLSITAMLLVAISGGVRFALSAHGAQSRLSAHQEDLLILDRVFRTLIGHAMPGSTDLDVRFLGESHTLRFTTLAGTSAAPATPGLADIAIAVDRRHRLVLTWQPHAPSLIPGHRPQSVEVLAEDIDHLDISYETPATGVPTWRNDWTGEGLPDLVRLHLVLPVRERVHLPDIVAQTWLRDRAQ